jgi:hypothetical protein
MQLLAAAIALLNNLVSDEDVRSTVISQLSAHKGDFQVGSGPLCLCACQHQQCEAAAALRKARNALSCVLSSCDCAL